MVWDQSLKKEYDKFCDKKLSINMERGWPCEEQLGLSMPLLDMVHSGDALKYEVDYRSYAGAGGIQPAKELFAEMLDVSSREIYIGGTMSTTIMYDIVERAMQAGFDGFKPWKDYNEIIFLCPSPGYEKHFKICEAFGIRMIPINLCGDGPDMEKVEQLVKENENIKGIWCVPLYSNPTGEIYSEKTVRRLAGMETKAKDFKIFWDHAYCVHHLTETQYTVLNILKECKAYGNASRPIIFASTSKITFPGGGVAGCAACEAMIEWIQRNSLLQLKTGDKINQLRHVRFLKNLDGIYAHMEKHRAIIAPKFQLADQILSEYFSPGEIVEWEKPKGGYFINLKLRPQMADPVWRLCREAGVRITPAGSTFPYGRDEKKQYLRLAPTSLGMETLEDAVRLLSCVIKNVSINQGNQNTREAGYEKRS